MRHSVNSKIGINPTNALLLLLHKPLPSETGKEKERKAIIIEENKECRPCFYYNINFTTHKLQVKKLK